MEKVKAYLSNAGKKLSKKIKSLTKAQKILLGLTSAYICYNSIRAYKQNPKSIKDKVVFVTGGANGIGRALVIRFAKQGAKVVIADINDTKSEELSNSLLSEGYQVLSVHCDVSDFESVQRAAYITKTHFGSPSIVVNNAGILTLGPLKDFSTEDFEKTLRVNLFSQFYTIKVFLPSMIEANEGHFINIASYGGHTSYNGLGAYCASKHAVVGLNNVLRQEMKAEGKNIKVTIASFTMVDTDMTKSFGPELKRLPVDYVADKIFTGILYEKSEIYIPGGLYKNAFALKYLMSADNRDWLSAAMG